MTNLPTWTRPHMSGILKIKNEKEKMRKTAYHCRRRPCSSERRLPLLVGALPSPARRSAADGPCTRMEPPVPRRPVTRRARPSRAALSRDELTGGGARPPRTTLYLSGSCSPFPVPPCPSQELAAPSRLALSMVGEAQDPWR